MEFAELPVVLPIVFYHGKQPWNYPNDMRKFVPNYAKLHPTMKDSLPLFTYTFINLQQQDDQFIEQYDGLTRVFMTAFKYVFADIDTLLKKFMISMSEFRGVIAYEEFVYYIEMMLIYFSATHKDFTEEKLQQSIQEN